MDLTGGPVHPHPQPAKPAPSLSQPFGAPSLGQAGGFGAFGLNTAAGPGPAPNQPTGFGAPNFGLQANGFNQGFGGQGFGQQAGFGASQNTGFGSHPQPGFGGGFGAQPQPQGQPKKLITFDSKPTANDEFSTFQEARPKNPVALGNAGAQELHVGRSRLDRPVRADERRGEKGEERRGPLNKPGGMVTVPLFT